MENERVYAKIVVKGNYDKANDLVFRPLIRAYEEIGAKTLLEDGEAVILGTIDENGVFHELFTKKEIEYRHYEIIDKLMVWYKIATLTKEEMKKLENVIRRVIFKEDISLDFEVSSMRDLAEDRRIEFEAYNHSLVGHNPYSEPYNGYNDFSFKLEKVLDIGK